MDNTYTPSGGSIPQMIVNDGLYAGHVTQTTDPVEITRLLEADAQAEQVNPLPVDNINTNPMEVKQAMNKIIMGHSVSVEELLRAELERTKYTLEKTCDKVRELQAQVQEEYKGYVSSDYARRLEETNLELRKQIEQSTPTPAPAPTPEWTDVLSKFDSLFSAALLYIKPQLERMVEAKFAAMVDNNMTLTKLDSDIEQKMREIASEIAEEVADAKIYNHERNEDHFNDDYIDDKVSEAVRENDLTERRIEEMISDAIENHTQETDHPDEGDIEHIVDQFTETNDFLNKDNLGDYLLPALKKALNNNVV